MQDVSADTLKLVLSEVLRDLRQAEKMLYQIRTEARLFPYYYKNVKKRIY